MRFPSIFPTVLASREQKRRGLLTLPARATGIELEAASQGDLQSWARTRRWNKR